jgi:hypothetical protein
MKHELGQIYFAPIELNQAKYARPFIVLQLFASEAVICSLSTKFDLKQPADLALFASDPSFASTGLKVDSYLVFRSTHAEPIALLDNAKKIGRVENEIKRQVEGWWGAPLD